MSVNLSRLLRPAATRALLLLLLGATVSVGPGCDRDPALTKGKDPGGNEPVLPATLPATRPADEAAARADASYLYFSYPGRVTATGQPIENIPVRFPGARLHLTAKEGEPVRAMLFSDDPKEAISRDWAGDRYYFDVKLNTDSLEQVDGARWVKTSSAAAEDRDESGNGVFLKGDRVQLDPANVIVIVDGKLPQVQVTVSGEFLQYDANSPASPPQRVVVQGVLMPRVVTKD